MKKVLIVDDSKTLTDILNASIIKTIQCSVTIARSYAEAQQILESDSDFFAAVPALWNQ